MFTWKLEKEAGDAEAGPVVTTPEQAMRSAEGHFVRGIGQVAMEQAEAPIHPDDPKTPLGPLDELPAEWLKGPSSWTWTPLGWEWTYTVAGLRMVK